MNLDAEEIYIVVLVKMAGRIHKLASRLEATTYHVAQKKFSKKTK